jgi:hypothetical protein
MKLTPDYDKKAFVEIINGWDHYHTCVTVQAGQIPEGAAMMIEHRGDDDDDGYYAIRVYRLHPFSPELIAARLDMQRLSDSVSDASPTIKFSIISFLLCLCMVTSFRLHEFSQP